jgi:hypothetical protein
MAKIEAGQFEEALIIVNPRRFAAQPPMTEPELAAHREAVRAVAANPKGVMICYQSEGDPDPLAVLLGEAEAEAINRNTRKVAIKRSYWHA